MKRKAWLLALMPVCLAAGCGGAPARAQLEAESRPAASGPPLATLPGTQTGAAGAPLRTPAFDACIAMLRTRALGAGVSATTFDTHLRAVVPDLSVLAKLDAQPEFITPIWDYLASLVDDERVDDGKRMLTEHADTLAQVDARFGVDAATVVAVWGVESNYGRNFGKRPLLTSLATLSCMGRRQSYFRSELLSALQIIQSGDVAAAALVGSWAGAFGHTQFMPSTFRRVAVDFDGDGRRDLVGNVADALASTAHYLQRSGWRAGRSWGFEAALPAGVDPSLAGRGRRRPLGTWLAMGIQRADGTSIDQDHATPAALLLPAGAHGPAFLVFGNYDAIYSYNAAENYALAIALLSDRLRGQGGLKTPWPTDDPGLSRKEQRELQTLLLARGYAIGEVDGIIGTATRQAIRSEQQRRGLVPADGRAGRRILQLLRADAGSPVPL